MKAVMKMTLDTTWGNAVELQVESELDNTHTLTTAELCRLQVYTLTMMVAEVRRESERQLGIRATEEDPPPAHEEERFREMEASHESERRVHDVRRAAAVDEELSRAERQEREHG